MMLDLSETELRELLDALEVRLEGMMHELVRAEHRDFRDALRATYEELDQLRKRLRGALEEVQAHA